MRLLFTAPRVGSGAPAGTNKIADCPQGMSLPYLTGRCIVKIRTCQCRNRRHASSRPVVRLADDAALLRDADRQASAFVLAVIHLEEIGKLIICMWRHIRLELPVREQRDHVSKQSAVFSLILAADLKDKIISQLNGQTIDDAGIAQMAEQVASANAGIHLVAAQQQLMQQSKHAGLYVDAFSTFIWQLFP